MWQFFLSAYLNVFRLRKTPFSYCDNYFVTLYV